MLNRLTGWLDRRVQSHVDARVDEITTSVTREATKVEADIRQQLAAERSRLEAALEDRARMSSILGALSSILRTTADGEPVLPAQIQDLRRAALPETVGIERLQAEWEVADAKAARTNSNQDIVVAHDLKRQLAKAREEAGESTVWTGKAAAAALAELDRRTGVSR